jgi:4-amino-4-deoxy-L-arabinose transferase-like glycosyltransferase
MIASITKDKRALALDNNWFWALLLVTGIAGTLLLRYVTPYGLGLFNDSSAYIGGASNILNGNGYTRLAGDGTYKPVTNNPPMYPFMLIIAFLLGLQPLIAAWWISALFFAANIVLVGIFVRKLTGSNVFGFIAALLFPACQVFLYVHTLALSEPVFIFNYLLALFCLTKYLEGSRRAWLVAAGLFASFTYITRYVGVSLYGTALLALLVFSSSWKKRIGDGLIFLAGGLPVVAAWTVRNVIVSGTAANRTLLYHPIPLSHIVDGIHNFWSWLLPERFGILDHLVTLWNLAFMLFLGVLFVGFVFGARSFLGGGKIKGLASYPLALILSLQALMFLATLVFTLTFLDASPIFEPRIIMPFLLCVFFLIFGLLSWIWMRNNRYLRLGTILLVIALGASFAEDNIDQVRDLHLDGQGYIAASWRNSDTMQAVRQLPPSVWLYSNKIMAINLLSDRSAIILPSPYNPATDGPRADYMQTVDKTRQRVLAGQAVMVIFDFRNLEDPNAEQWMHDLTDNIPMMKEYGDGAIFGVIK